MIQKGESPNSDQQLKSENQSNGSGGIAQVENNSAIRSSGATSGQSLLDQQQGFSNNRMQDPSITPPQTSSEGNNGGAANQQPSITYVPIILFCCPNIIKNEPCFCGPHSTVPVKLPSLGHMNDILN
jgi:hypothetical protein